MSRWSFERGLRATALAAVFGVGLACVGFYFAQNRFALTGGAVALSKSVWLGYAVLFWFVLPALLVSDRRIRAQLRWIFIALLVLMVLRAGVELWMLYVSHNWSPRYGIAHDLLCAGIVWALAARAWYRRCQQTSGHPNPVVLRHAAFTGTLFIPEIYFAWYMQSNFQTHGESPIYFVPDSAAHGVVLNVTAAVDVLASAYLVWFLYAWLYGKADGARA